MSVYLYGFQTKANRTPVKGGTPVDLYNLTFRMSSLGRTPSDDAREERISAGLERAWEGRELPEFFVIEKRVEGEEVYQTQRPLCHAEWVDCNHYPGKAERVGTLSRIGGRFSIILD